MRVAGAIMPIVPRTTVVVALAFTVLLPTLTAQDVVDSLLRVLPGQRGLERVRTLGELQWEVGYTDPKKALVHGREALGIAELLGDSSAIAIAANDMAVSAHRAADYPLAVMLNHRALSIRLAAKDSAGIAASHAKLSTAYTELQRLDSALYHGFRAADLFEALHDPQRSAQMRGNLSRIYQLQGSFEQAAKAAQRAVELLLPSGNTYAIASAWGQLGTVRIDLKEYGAAYEDLMESKKLFEGIGALNDAAVAANQLGIVCRKTGRMDEGRTFYEEAMAMAERSNDPAGQATYAHNIGNVLLDLGRTKEALRYYERSVALSRAHGFIATRIEVLNDLAIALESQGMLSEALSARRELAHLKDSINTADRAAKLAEMQVKYETERTEKELLAEQARGQQQENELAAQRLRVVLLVGGMALLMLITAVVLLVVRARHRAQLSARVIAEREQGLRAMVESTEAERKRIASELHDGVGQLLTGLKFRMEALAVRQPEVGSLLPIADDAGREVRGIAHRMMPRALADLGLVAALTDMLNSALALPGMHHTFDHFGMEGRWSPDLELGVYRIAQELVNNVIKHARATNVSVQLLANKGSIVLSVEDDGIGMDPAAAAGGFGMRSLHDRARMLHGTFHVEAASPKGTRATLRVPMQHLART